MVALADIDSGLMAELGDLEVDSGTDWIID